MDDARVCYGNKTGIKVKNKKKIQNRIGLVTKVGQSNGTRNSRGPDSRISRRIWSPLSWVQPASV